MSNPTVSFRISDYHLARGLRAIRNIEPAWQLITPSDLIRTIFNDYIAKSEAQTNTPLDVSQELLAEIISARLGNKPVTNKYLEALPQLSKPTHKSTEQIQRELEEDKAFNDMKRESLAKQALEQEQLAIENSKQQAKQEADLKNQITLASKSMDRLNLDQTKIKPSEFDDPNLTESEISTVTDFSPPADWIK